uniref:Ketoreductase domain-containing protein n=1 Tax=Cuerna arida TaxID=1464854 RepID=A0A1B6GXM3_9HEMI
MFSGKVVLITGASSGIGAATALEFAKSGANLSLTGRNEENLQKIASDCEKVSKMKALIVIADVAVEADVKNIMDSTIKHFGRLDVLVNNAGISGSGSIENTSLQQYDEILNTNLRSVYHLTMLAVPYLAQSQGNIVNISSTAGIRSFPGFLAYSLSKSAVDQFTRCVALELAGKQVRVNCVDPGVIVTELQRRRGMDEKSYQEFLEKSKKHHALGRVGQPSEIADAILFLASEKASFITGVNLPVDGGRHAMCPM